MTDSKSCKIRNQCSRVAKGKVSIELQAVRRDRYSAVILHEFLQPDRT